MPGRPMEGSGAPCIGTGRGIPMGMGTWPGADRGGIAGPGPGAGRDDDDPGAGGSGARAGMVGLVML